MKRFVEGYNQLPDGRCIWMIQASMPRWHWNNWIDNRPSKSPWGRTDSPASRYRMLHQLKRGDIAFCYQGNPDHCLLGVARVSRGGHFVKGGVVFELDWWMRVPPVGYDKFTMDPILSTSEKVIVRQGSLLRVSASEARQLLSLIPKEEVERIAKKLKLPSEIIPTSFKQEVHCADLDKPPEKIQARITRIVRDTAMTSEIKSRSGYICVICGERLMKSDGAPYAEAHHLQPLGGKHRGPDKKENVIVLCPNHHAEFDFGAIAINPESGRIEHADSKNVWHGSKPKEAVSEVSKRFIEYHYKHVFRQGGS